MTGVRWAVPVVMTVCATLAAPTARGQDVLTLARVQLRAGNSDSAIALLRVLTDSGSTAPREQILEAWILTGIARFHGGRDSAAAAAFREAFALDPDARVDGLGQMDSTLVALFEAQRPDTASFTSDSLYDCRQRCPGGLSKPVLAYFPYVNQGDIPAVESQTRPGAGGLGPSGMHGAIVYEFVVTDVGSVAPETVRVVRSNARTWERVFSRPLLAARFEPAHQGARSVSAWVRLRVEIRAEGTQTFRYEFRGP